MKKYYIGFIFVGLITLGLTGYTIAEGLKSKQDNITEQRAKEIAKDLNKYVSQKRQIPESLAAAGIKDVPSTIKYEKLSDKTYKFCETYRQASSYGFSDGITPLLTGGAINRYGGDQEGISLDEYESSYLPGSLYPSYSHKKGENCQTIKPYSLSSSRDKFDDYNENSEDILDEGFGFDNSDFTRDPSTKLDDIERETDIKALHSQIEAYYAQNGKYPTLANLNDKAFRTANMKGLDDGTLKDPKGTASALVASPAKNVYSYKVNTGSVAACAGAVTDCSKYTLTATLENGSAYTKESLN